MRGFGWDVPFTAAFMTVCVLVLGTMIPAGPGFAGTYQASLTLGLSIFGLDANEAAAFGIVVYPANIIIIVSFGLPYLSMGKTSSAHDDPRPVGFLNSAQKSS